MSRWIPGRMTFAVVAALAMLVLLAASHAWANGAYVPPVAVDAVPAIPRQTALIRHADGIETLLVESEADVAEGDRFAWILPVPSRPTSIDAVGPATLASLRECIRREINANARPGNFASLFVLLLLMAGWAEGILRRRGGGRLLEIAIVAAIMWGLAGISVASRGASSTGIEGVDVLDRTLVGNYETAVVEARSAADLQAWLRANDFASLDAARERIVDLYVGEGWTFVVSKLRREGGTLLAPHPLKVVFRAERPVFPMRLTAQPGQQTDVALFMVGKAPFEHPLFSIEVRDIATRRAGIASGWRDDELEVTSLRGIAGKGFSLGNQDVVALVEDGDWITRLQATLSAEQMTDDIYPTVSAEKVPYQATVCTTAAARAWSIQAALLVAILGIPFLGLLKREKRGLAGPAGGILLAAAVAGGLVYTANPRTDSYVLVSRRVLDHSLALLRLESVLLEKHPDDPGNDAARVRAVEKTLDELRADGYPYVQGARTRQYHYRNDGAAGLTINLVQSDGFVIEIPLARLWAE